VSILRKAASRGRSALADILVLFVFVADIMYCWCVDVRGRRMKTRWKEVKKTPTYPAKDVGLTRPHWSANESYDCGMNRGEISLITHTNAVKGKSFLILVMSIGHRGGSGVQAVSLQVALSHPTSGRLPFFSASPAVTFPAEEPVGQYQIILFGDRGMCSCRTF